MSLSDCEDGLVTAKSRLLDLLSELDGSELNSIEQWISSQAYKQDLKIKKQLLKTEKLLTKISTAIKKIVPLVAEMTTENIEPPKVGDQADCNIVNTCHVDEFLYDENDVEELVKEGKLRRHYCLDCNSRNTKELIYISHSMSKRVLQFLFEVTLPKDLEGKVILDVGSRLGAVIFSAYHVTNASSIIGVEMNKECCEVQEQIIDQFSMDRKRIKVEHSDITLRSDLIEQSKIIIINVLDFFVNTEKHKEMWYFFKKYMKRGTCLICNRSMEDTLTFLEIYEDFMDWLTVSKPNQMQNEIYFDIEDCSEIFFYTVR